MNFVFMGSADFGIPGLERLVASGHRLAGIVTTPGRPGGRGLKVVESEVAGYARRSALGPVRTPESLKDAEFLNWLSSLDADLFVVAAYRILPPEVFTIPRRGTVNIHASLLPRYRGPAPIQRAIEAGETETGVTIFRIDKGIDTGGIILQKAVSIGERETTPQLYQRLSTLGAEALSEAVDAVESARAAYVTQDESRASRAPKLRKEEAQVCWRQSVRQIFNRIRAFKPFPGTFTLVHERRLGIEWAEPVSGGVEYEPGMVCRVQEDRFDVQCGEGVLGVLEVKPEGRKRMDAGAFMRGSKIACGMVLE